MKNRFFIVFALITLGQLVYLISIPTAFAGNFGFGAHGGYGVIKYEEENTVSSPSLESTSTQNTVLLGLSGEYSFSSYYTGVTTDWTVGMGDRDETWKRGGNTTQTNNMKVLGQFYDVRLGYKNELNKFSYRVYSAGGWDGMHFRRRNFTVGGVGSTSGPITEDFSLWRMGGGLDLGYKLGTWFLNGRAAYAYYVNGEVTNSSWPSIGWDTNGTCMDFGMGFGKEIQNMKFYIGFIYTLIDLDQDIQNSGSTQVVFPNSTIEMMFGVANLTYAF